MPVRAEVQRRAEHLGRSMKAGLSPLWVIVTAAVAVVGGSALLAALWGVKHLIWGLIILLVAAFAVLAEGSYRLSRSRGSEHAEQVKKLEQERDATRTELEEIRHELEDAQRAAISAPAVLGAPPLVARYDQSARYRHPMDSQPGITEHFVGVFNPGREPARRARMHLVRMDPYPRNVLQPQYRPAIPYTVPPQSGGDPSAGLTIGPGQEEYWIIGYTSAGGGNMYAGGFAVSDQYWRGLPWQVDPDERWRLSYEIVCDGMPDVKFSIVVAAEDGQIKLHLEG
jgi:hypothetical protein